MHACASAVAGRRGQAGGAVGCLPATLSSGPSLLFIVPRRHVWRRWFSYLLILHTHHQSIRRWHSSIVLRCLPLRSSVPAGCDPQRDRKDPVANQPAIVNGCYRLIHLLAACYAIKAFSFHCRKTGRTTENRRRLPYVIASQPTAGAAISDDRIVDCFVGLWPLRDDIPLVLTRHELVLRPGRLRAVDFRLIPEGRGGIMTEAARA
jgi:hypothetical protein